MVAAVVAYWYGTAGQKLDVDYHTVLEDTLVVFGLEVDTEYDAVVEYILIVACLEVAEHHAVVECTLVVASLEVAAEYHIGTLVVADLKVDL